MKWKITNKRLVERRIAAGFSEIGRLYTLEDGIEVFSYEKINVGESVLYDSVYGIKKILKKFYIDI